jgi:O-methyltransferase involved in polyketide biosynthesis
MNHKLAIPRQLSGDESTLLACLWARGEESRHRQAILRDAKAVEIVNTLDYDFDSIARCAIRSVEICIRATLIDALVAEFLAAHPDGTVVDLGSGLDTRFDRLDNGQARWFEVDLPNVIELRRLFFEQGPRRTFLGTSVMDEAWLDVVREQSAPQRTMFVAEGMLYFVGDGNVQTLFGRLARGFPGASIVFDTQSPLFAKLSHWRGRTYLKTRIRWSIADVRQIEQWDAALKLERNIQFGDSPQYDSFLHRLPLYMRLAPRLFPPSRRFFQVSQVRFAPAVA